MNRVSPMPTLSIVSLILTTLVLVAGACIKNHTVVKTIRKRARGVSGRSRTAHIDGTWSAGSSKTINYASVGGRQS